LGEEKMANDKFLSIILLAAVSDGKLQEQEIAMLRRYRLQHPGMKQISDDQEAAITADIYNKLSAGMDVLYIIEDLGRNLTQDQKNAGYALAREVCAADYKVLPAEQSFLTNIEEKWKIPKDVIASIEVSLTLRYFT